MRREQKLKALLLTSSIWMLAITPAWSQMVKAQGVQQSSSEQRLPVLSKARVVKPITEIRRLNEIERPARSARMLVQSPAQETAPSVEVVQVTNVKANPTKKGVEVILQTTKGEQLQLNNYKVGNNFIVDILNAQLRMPSGEAFIFRSQQSIAGIAQITVVNKDANTIRVTVQGKSGAPIVELYDSPNEGLIFSIASAPGATQQGQQPQTQQPPASQPESETQPQRPSASGDEPIELVVTGQQDGYNRPNADTATKTDTPLRDIPQAIQVIPRQLIQDQQATRTGDVLRNISGVQQPAGTSRSHFDIFFIRGFSSANEGVLRNGLRDRANTRSPSETSNLERIEVLKGPSAALYGQGGLGGTINLVTEKPLSEPYYSVEATIGSFDFYRGAFDISGPLNAEKTLLYRLNASAETTDSFVDYINSQRFFVSPVLTWLISDNTKLTFEAEYIAALRVDEWGLPAVGTVLPNPNGKIPRDRYTGEPDEQDNRYTFRVGYDLEHRFSENWQARNAFRVTFQKNQLDNITYFPGNLQSDNRTLQRSAAENVDNPNAEHYALDTYVVGKFKTGSIQHQLVTGFDLFREFLPANGLTRSSSINVFNPVYGRPLGPITSRTQNETTRDALGIYIQDQITLADNLKLLLGGRFDILTQELEDFLNPRNNYFRQNESFSPRVGIVYQPIPALSLYASYSRAINQVVGTTFDNRLFEPERGTQYEVGIKADLSDRVSGTLAFYDLTKSNVLTTNPTDSRLSIQTGEQRSRGIELDLSGEILPGWNIIAAYAYTNAEVIKDTRYKVGNRLDNVPENSASLWTTYEIQKGDFKGLSFGLGLYYVGERQGDLANSFSLPDYFRTDASISYKRGQFRAAVNVRNLFDIDYFESSASRTRVFYGDPLTILGTVKFEF